MTTRKTCEEIRELLPCFVDGGVTAAEDQRVQEHLADCAECRREAEHWAALNRVLAAGLAEGEPVPAEAVEAAVRRVRTVRPAWRIAPTPVRFWRAWTPAAAVVGLAAVFAVVALTSLGSELGQAGVAFREQASAVAAAPADLAAVPSDLAALHEAARSWPQQAREQLETQWSEGAALSAALVHRVGAAPLAACLLVILAANVLFARSARHPRRRVQEG